MSTWKNTKYPGVRYYEHESRKHGIQKDRYFAIRYQRDGKRREEGLGWSSEGWTAEKAVIELSRLKRASILGEGPTTLKEKRGLEKERRLKEQEEKARRKKESLTFGEYFLNTYYPIAQISKKRETYVKDLEHFHKWINSVIGQKPFKEIKPFTIEKLKKNMLDAGLSPRSIQYNFATIRQVWNMARRDGIVNEDTPTKAVKIPKVDNKRLRFLTHEEADVLLKDLQVRDTITYNMALLSLHCGLRAGEIFNLKWGNVDLDRGQLTIMDAKGNKCRVAFLTKATKEMLSKLLRKDGKEPRELVFTNKQGEKFTEIPDVFESVVRAVGLNEGIDDPRHRVVFHTLRHTYASWLVESGTDLYTVKELLGHGTITMTERYSHLGNGTLQSAIRRLEKSMEERQKEKILDLKKE